MENDKTDIKAKNSSIDTEKAESYINIFSDALLDFTESYYETIDMIRIPEFRDNSLIRLGKTKESKGSDYHNTDMAITPSNPHAGKRIGKNRIDSGIESAGRSVNREKLQMIDGSAGAENENAYGFSKYNGTFDSYNGPAVNYNSGNETENHNGFFDDDLDSGTKDEAGNPAAMQHSARSEIDDFNAVDIKMSGPFLTGLNNAAGRQATPGNVDGYRQFGGLAAPFKKYIVGENGPEILNMGSESGSIIPNNTSAGNSTPVITINNNVTINAEAGTADGSFADKLKKALDDISLTEFRAKAGLS